MSLTQCDPLVTYPFMKLCKASVVKHLPDPDNSCLLGPTICVNRDSSAQIADLCVVPIVSWVDRNLPSQTVRYWSSFICLVLYTIAYGNDCNNFVIGIWEIRNGDNCNHCNFYEYMDGSVQHYSNSNALAMELMQFCIKLLIWLCY